MVEEVTLAKRCLYIGYSPLRRDEHKNDVYPVADMTELKRLWETQIMPQLLSTNTFECLIVDTTAFVPSNEDLEKLTEKGMYTIIIFPTGAEGGLIIMDVTDGVYFKIDEGGSDE
jgi:hypothetical protein